MIQEIYHQVCDSCGYPPEAGHSSECPANKSNTNESEEGKVNYQKLSSEEWKNNIRDSGMTSIMYSFENFNPTYYKDGENKFYILYEEDGQKQGRMIYTSGPDSNGNTKSVSQEIVPEELEKAVESGWHITGVNESEIIDNSSSVN